MILSAISVRPHFGPEQMGNWQMLLMKMGVLSLGNFYPEIHWPGIWSASSEYPRPDHFHSQCWKPKNEACFWRLQGSSGLHSQKMTSCSPEAHGIWLFSPNSLGVHRSWWTAETELMSITVLAVLMTRFIHRRCFRHRHICTTQNINRASPHTSPVNVSPHLSLEGRQLAYLF